MQEDLLIKRAQELCSRARNKNIITCSDFLTPAEQAVLAQSHLPCADAYFYGGRDFCERKLAIYLPDYLTPDTFEVSDCISAFCGKTRMAQLSHRDWLGALMGLGIERDAVGDIILDGDLAYFFCVRRIAPYIEQSLEKAGRAGVSLSQCDMSDVPKSSELGKSVTFTVASTRLDSVAAGAFSLSRTAVLDKIKLGIVSLNHITCQKPERDVVSGDLISMRGKGRAYVREIGGSSRKGRIFVTVEFFGTNK